MAVEFKVGDRVRYKKSAFENAITNTHDPKKVYTISEIQNDFFPLVMFEGSDEGCFPGRLELVNEAKNVTKSVTGPYAQTTWALIDKTTGEIFCTCRTRQEARWCRTDDKKVAKVKITYEIL